jgi:hypothetical protein
MIEGKHLSLFMFIPCIIFILSLLFWLMHYIIHIMVLASALGFKTSLKFHFKTFAKTFCWPLSLLHVSDTSVHLQGVFLDLVDTVITFLYTNKVYGQGLAAISWCVWVPVVVVLSLLVVLCWSVGGLCATVYKNVITESTKIKKYSLKMDTCVRNM